MGFEVKHLIRVILLAALGEVISFWATLPSLAGGFTQPENFTFSSFSFSTFDSNNFHKEEIQFYLEHGLQNNLTFIFKSPYTWSEENGDSNQGFSGQELGLRWRFNRDPFWATAIQGSLIIPLGYDADEDPSGSGNQVVGVELSLPISRGFQVGKQRFGYGTLEVGYRDYFGPVSDELRLTGEVSVDVVRRLALAAQFYGIYRLQESENEDFSKLGGQIRWRTHDSLTLVVGGFKNLTQEGGSFEAQIWYTFGSRNSKPIPPTEPTQ